MDVRDKLLTENPWKLMIHLSLPAILGLGRVTAIAKGAQKSHHHFPVSSQQPPQPTKFTAR